MQKDFYVWSKVSLIVMSIASCYFFIDIMIQVCIKWRKVSTEVRNEISSYRSGAMWRQDCR